MADTRNIIEKEMVGRSASFKQALKESISSINEGIKDRPEGCLTCSGEWLKEFEMLVDSLHKELFSISEPRNSSPATHKKLIELRHRLHDLYANQSSCCH